jgi:hypothetical protein
MKLRIQRSENNVPDLQVSAGGEAFSRSNMFTDCYFVSWRYLNNIKKNWALVVK